MEVIIIIIILSFPIFYLYGIISFLRHIFNKKKTDSPATDISENELLRRLQAAAKRRPGMTLMQFLSSVDETSEILPDIQAKPAVATPAEPTKSSQVHTNWTSDESINFMLYIGAFLIVAAVSIFISFQWASLSGVTKALLVWAFTAAWFVAGTAFSRNPKMENASISFYTISSLLVPFCGIAWYQFVMSASTNEFGFIWLLTSIVSTLVYLYFGLLLNRRYFTYLASLSLLSVSTSLVNISDAQVEYYVLTSVITALLLLLARLWIQKDQHLEKRFGMDIQVSSATMLVLSIVTGISLIMSQGESLTTVQTTIVATLTSLYFWIYYFTQKEQLAYIVALSTSIITVIIAGLWLQVDNQILTYLIIGLGFCLNLQRLPLVPSLKQQEFEAKSVIGLVAMIMAYIFGLQFESSIANLLTSLVITCHILWMALEFEYEHLHGLLVVSIWFLQMHLLIHTNVAIQWIAPSFSLLSAGFYLASVLNLVPAKYRDTYAYAGLIGATIAAFIPAQLLMFRSSDFLWYQSMSPKYAAMILFGLHSLLRKSTNNHFLAVFAVLVTYVSQLRYLEPTFTAFDLNNIQLYSLPIGLFFMYVAYKKTERKPNEATDLFAILGAATIILPTVFSAFKPSASHAVLLVAYGVGFMTVGNALKYKLLQYAAAIAIVLAVFSQTADFIFSIPRWILTGLAGMGFIGTAVFLLSQRGKKS